MVEAQSQGSPTGNEGRRYPVLDHVSDVARGEALYGACEPVGEDVQAEARKGLQMGDH